jgi:excisionase family DNA binding protein
MPQDKMETPFHAFPNSASHAEIPSQLLNAPEAAGFLRVSIATLYGWVHCRKIPFRKHGSRLVFCRQELESWSQAKGYGVLNEGAPQVRYCRDIATARPKGAGL